MKKLVSRIVFCTLLLSINWAFAGVRGYRVIFIDLTPEQEIKPIFLKYRNTANLQSISNCWDGRKGEWIDITYVKTQPVNIAQETIKLSAEGDKMSIKEFARLLSLYRDDEITSGFDGAYFVSKEGGQYVRLNAELHGT